MADDDHHHHHHHHHQYNPHHNPHHHHNYHNYHHSEDFPLLADSHSPTHTSPAPPWPATPPPPAPHDPPPPPWPPDEAWGGGAVTPPKAVRSQASMDSGCECDTEGGAPLPPLHHPLHHLHHHHHRPGMSPLSPSQPGGSSPPPTEGATVTFTSNDDDDDDDRCSSSDDKSGGIEAIETASLTDSEPGDGLGTHLTSPFHPHPHHYPLPHHPRLHHYPSPPVPPYPHPLLHHPLPRHPHLPQYPHHTPPAFPRVASYTSCPGALSTSSSTASMPMCRICHHPQGDTRLDTLISPCRCSGTMQYIHQGCLNKWLEVKRCKKAPACELCNYPFNRHKKFRLHHWQLPACSRADKLLHAVFVVCLLVMVACATVTIICFKQDRIPPRRSEGSELTRNEVITLSCGVLFFVAFFVAMYVEVKARNTLYRLCARFVYLNHTWHIADYDRRNDTLLQDATTTTTTTTAAATTTTAIMTGLGAASTVTATTAATTTTAAAATTATVSLQYHAPL